MATLPISFRDKLCIPTSFRFKTLNPPEENWRFEEIISENVSSFYFLQALIHPDTIELHVTTQDCSLHTPPVDPVEEEWDEEPQVEEDEWQGDEE